jgi:hypothetical protein
MADLADLAGENDYTLEILTRHRNSKKTLVTRGVCQFCEAEIGANLVYCDAECREDHEKLTRSGRGNH